MIKVWSNESKALSISIVTKNPSLLKMTVISIMSSINLPLSPINLFSTYAVWCGEIKLGLDARAISLSFFSVSFRIAYPCKVLNSFLRSSVRHEFEKISFISSENATKNSFVSPSFLGDLLFCTLIKDMYNSFSDS